MPTYQPIRYTTSASNNASQYDINWSFYYPGTSSGASPFPYVMSTTLCNDITYNNFGKKPEPEITQEDFDEIF